MLSFVSRERVEVIVCVLRSEDQSRLPRLGWDDEVPAGEKACGAVSNIQQINDMFNITMASCEKHLNFICVKSATQVLLSSHESGNIAVLSN